MGAAKQARKLKRLTWRLMTPSERKVALAKDVISQVQAGTLIPNQGAYVEFEDSVKAIGLVTDINKKVSGRKLSKIKEAGCMVCARGALLISRVDQFNSLRYRDIGFVEASGWDSKPGTISCSADAEDTVEGLDGSFEREELELIEAAFEETGSLGECEHDRDLLNAAANYFDGERLTAEDKMICIMQNIVDHGGEFNPYVKYDAYWE